MTDEELKALVASLAIAQQKTDEQQAKTDAQLAETDAHLKRVSDKVDRIAEFVRSTDVQLAATDAQIAATSAQLAETDAYLKKVSDKVDRIADLVGNIANNQGDVAEEFFYSSLLNDATLGNMHFDTIYRNLPGKKAKLTDEFDIVLANDKNVAIIEVKQKAHPKLIEDMLERKLPNFRKLFPWFKKQKLYGVIASLVSNDAMVEKSQEAGLFFMTQQGNHIVLVNDKVKTF